ncbi:MAG: 2-C-methyl-D-erythritol 4-phosphate cytidylyltransferase [Fimbriimonadaceae bacterium]|nr:2-C-methyl-D-erythritol 4-phosphate cytidylyltransferase [Fimbriimonadaceae bacterium]
MPSPPIVYAVLVAAGRGERFGGDKLWLDLDGAPLWRHAYRAFRDNARIAGVGIVVAPERVGRFRSEAPDADFVVPGGETRQESARRGVTACPDEAEIVLIHDAARPFVTPALIERVIAGVVERGAAAPGLPITDTVKRLGEEGIETLDRTRLRTVQTPQGALRGLLVRAFGAADRSFTDELSMLEAFGANPVLVEGDPDNLKITHPGDADLARALLSPRTNRPMETRTGLGYDVHAFSADPDRPLWLGGVLFEGHAGLEGHSDADVLLHAIADAILGAAGKDDIGVHFPNSDPKWAGCASKTFLEVSKDLVEEEGWRMVNIDATVIAETPRLGSKRDDMRLTIAQTLGLPSDRVNVKATTNERLGTIGRGEGIAAFAVATLVRGPS